MGPQHTARDEKMLRSQTPAQASKSSFHARSCGPIAGTPVRVARRSRAMRRMTRHVKGRPPAPGGYGPALWR